MTQTWVFSVWSYRYKSRCNGSKERVTRPSLIKREGQIHCWSTSPDNSHTLPHPLITHPIEKTAASPPTLHVLRHTTCLANLLTVELELQHTFSQFSFLVSINLMRKYDCQFCWPQIIVNDNSRWGYENAWVLKAERVESTGNKPYLDLMCERPTDIKVKYWETKTKDYCFSHLLLKNETYSNCDLVTVNAHNLWILVNVYSNSMPPSSNLFGVE